MFRFLADRWLQIIVPIWIELWIDGDTIDGTHIQPLIDKLVDELPRTIIVQHSRGDAFQETWLCQFPFFGSGE